MSRCPLPALSALPIVLGIGLGLTACEPTPTKADKTEPTYRFTGPYSHDNLTIVLIHGDDQLKDRKILTLDEAMQQKKVVVHETKNVQQLAIENISDQQIFVQAGDIVKGGQQDRLLGYDMLIGPKSGKVALASFCVEARRWSKRGAEDDGKFSSCKDYICSNALRLSSRQAMSQDGVWKEVANTQKKLTDNLGAKVQAKESDSSLQLTLEHKKVVEAIEARVKKLSTCLDGKNDVIGVAVIINGKVNNADVYASHELFTKLWPKLLRSSAIESVAELKKDKTFKPGKIEDVQAFFADVEKGKRTAKEINKQLEQVQKESKDNVLFETHDRSLDGVALRRSVIAK
jgi:hypothetical protein